MDPLKITKTHSTLAGGCMGCLGHRPYIWHPVTVITAPGVEFRLCEDCLKLLASWLPRSQGAPEEPIVSLFIDFNEAHVKAIVKMVASHYRVTPAAIMGRRRYTGITWPRHVAYWLTRKLSRKSYEFIGECFHRDHGTIIFGCRRVDSLRSTMAYGVEAKAVGKLLRQLTELMAGPKPEITVLKKAS